VCRYNCHSAGFLSWPFPLQKYQYIFQIKYTEAILSNSTRKLLWFEITKILMAVLEKKVYCVVCYNLRRTFVPCEARDCGVWGWQWHQLDHLLQTDNHTNIPLINFTGRILFLTPNQQCQSSEGKNVGIIETPIKQSLFQDNVDKPQSNHCVPQ